MALGLVGKKRGMTRVFTEEGASIPVTVLEVEPNRVTRLKNESSDGYTAVQVTSGSQRPGRINQSRAGEFKKAGVDAGWGLWEFQLNADGDGELELGAQIGVDIFEVGQRVDVSGTTIGKGFAGTIKRHNFRSGDATHGNSLAHRAAGSTGQCQTPGRVFKGKRMAGQMGNKRRTVQGLEVVRVDTERNLITLKGAVPGAKGGIVVVRPASKSRD